MPQFLLYTGTKHLRNSYLQSRSSQELLTMSYFIGSLKSFIQRLTYQARLNVKLSLMLTTVLILSGCDLLTRYVPVMQEMPKIVLKQPNSLANESEKNAYIIYLLDVIDAYNKEVEKRNDEARNNKRY